MSIDWYPGHMVTARNDAMEAMRQTDVVIEVLDARAPHSSCNPMVEALRRENQRPALKLLNKADLADPVRTAAWLVEYNQRPKTRAIALSAKSRGEVSRILGECDALAPGRGTLAKPLRMMILGVPNVGKSTLMNTLLNRRVAKVGDEPAITKMHMRHELGPGRWLIDTPGMTWPGIAQDVALKLAATHAIGRNAYEDDVVALDLLAYLLSNYRDRVVKRYGELGDDAVAVLSGIARARNLVMRGGEPDLQRAANIFLQDFRDGVLGRLTLETVAQVDARPVAIMKPPGAKAKAKARAKATQKRAGHQPRPQRKRR